MAVKPLKLDGNRTYRSIKIGSSEPRTPVTSGHVQFIFHSSELQTIFNLLSKMDIETFGLSDSQPNFLNLSLLICHLFAGGNFRMAHILYHHEAVDDRFLYGIDSACSTQIPEMTTDISAPEIFEPDHTEDQQTDYILQIIFLSRDKMAENMKRIKGSLPFYRIFVFSFSQDRDDQKWMDDIESIKDKNSSSLLLIHNRSSGTVKPFHLSKTSVEPIDLQTNPSKSDKDLFESALGEESQGRSFAVSYVNNAQCNTSSRMELQLNRTRFVAILYFKRLNMSYIDALSYRCNQSTSVNVYHTAVKPIRRPFYTELSTDFEQTSVTPT